MGRGLDAGESTEGRLTHASRRGRKIDRTWVVLGRGEVDRRSSYSCVVAVGDDLIVDRCSRLELLDFKSKIVGLRTRPPVVPDSTPTGVDHWSTLVAAITLHDMYVGGCCVL